MAGNVNNEILNIKTNADTSDLQTIERQLRDTADRLSGFLPAGRDAEKGSDAAESSFRSLLSTAADLTLTGAGLSAAFGAVTEVFKSTVGAVFEQEKAFNRLQAQTGATAEEMAMFEDEAKDIFLNNWGENMDDVVASMSQVARVTGATDDELQDLTEQSIIFRDVFDRDINESLRAAETLADNFGISADEAFDILTVGMQKTGDPGQDLLDTFHEYSTNFAEMGFSAEMFLNLLNQGLEAGVRNTDDIADGMREFQIRLRDKTSEKSIRKLIDPRLWEQFERGTRSAADIFEDMIFALGRIEDPLERNAMGVEIFGTKWEDLGESVFLALDPTSTSIGKFNEIADATERAGDAMSQGLGPAWEKLKRAGTQALNDALAPTVTMLADKLVPIIEQIVPTLQLFGDRLEWAFGMSRADGIFEIKQILRELGLDALAPLVDLGDQAVSTFSRFFDAFKEGGLKGVFSQLGTELKNAAPILFEEAKSLVKNHIITPMWNELKDPANWIAAGEFLKTLTGQILGKGWDAAIWMKTHLINPAWEELKKPSNWLGAADFLIHLTRDILGKGWNAMRWVTDNLISPAWSELTNIKNWSNAGEFLIKVTDTILGKSWNAMQWVGKNLIIPFWGELTNDRNWSLAGDFLQNLMSNIMGKGWDALNWVKTYIIDPLIEEIKNQFSNFDVGDFISQNNPFKGGGQINIAPGGSYKSSSGAVFSTAVSNLQASGKNYNTNYKGPQSAVIRDSGGWGVPGQPYGIGVPETYIPSERGNFVPLSQLGGGMQTVNVPVYLDGRQIAQAVWQQEERKYPGGRRR